MRLGLVARADDTVCSVDGCGRSVRYLSKQLCNMHYQRWRKHGSTDPRERTPWKHTPEARERIAESKRGERNPNYGRTEELSPNWKGNSVGYFGIHDWLTSRYGQPIGCEECGTTDPSKKYEWANISGEYRRDRADFRRLCKKCHNDADGVNLWQQINPRAHSGRTTYQGKTVSSRYKGVRASGYGTWRVTIKAHGITRNLGTYKTEEEAALVYNQAAREAWGDEAFQNEVSCALGL